MEILIKLPPELQEMIIKLLPVGKKILLEKLTFGSEKTLNEKLVASEKLYSAKDGSWKEKIESVVNYNKFIQQRFAFILDELIKDRIYEEDFLSAVTLCTRKENRLDEIANIVNTLDNDVVKSIDD